MAFSDLILQLGDQAKQLEETASTFRTENDAVLKGSETELRNSLAKDKSAVDQKLEADSQAAANRLAGLRRTLSDGFETIRADGTDSEKLDAKDAIASAVNALHDAAYYMLAAVAARDEASLVQADVASVDAVEIKGEPTDVPVAEEIDAVVTTEGETTDVAAIDVDVPAKEIDADYGGAAIENAAPTTDNTVVVATAATAAAAADSTVRVQSPAAPHDKKKKKTTKK
jgi:hypothetical protein